MRPFFVPSRITNNRHIQNVQLNTFTCCNPADEFTYLTPYASFYYVCRYYDLSSNTAALPIYWKASVLTSRIRETFAARQSLASEFPRRG